jgi:signal transduction histidine kinase
MLNELIIILGFLTLFIILLIYHFITKKKQEKIFSVFSEINEQIVLLEDIDTIALKIKTILIKYFNVKNCTILIHDDEENTYKFMNPESSTQKINNFNLYSEFFIFLEQNDNLFLPSQIEKNIKSSSVQGQARSYFKDLNSIITIPLIFERRLIGLINLEQKQDNSNLSKTDYQLLNHLRREISVAFTNSLLFAKISKLFEETEDQNKSLRDLDKTKSNFIANISHELRTPLVSVKGYIEYILSEKFGPLTDKQKNGLTISLKNVRRFERLINSLLLYAQIQAGKASLERTKTNLVGIITECIDEEKIISDQKGIKLYYEGPSDVTVFIDRDKIKQVLLNLVSNSIKFTEEGEVKVSLELNSDHALVSVIDTGIGIPKDKLDSVFERFVQVDDSGERKYGGTGLGLSIVKSILEMHGTNIQVESKLHKGTKFSFKLSLD